VRARFLPGARPSLVSRLSPRQHVANRLRVRLSAAMRRDPAGVQCVGDLVQRRGAARRWPRRRPLGPIRCGGECLGPPETMPRALGPAKAALI
jgi:hypothetical protein